MDERFDIFPEPQAHYIMALALLLALFIGILDYTGNYQPLPGPPVEKDGGTVIFLIP